MVKILIADDSSFQRKIIASILKEAGHEVISANNGKEGITRAGTEKPQLIITDLLMPEFDGYYLLEQAQAAKMGIPILILTSDIQNATRDRCMQLGAAGVINKPIRKDLLIPVVQRALSGERL
jgi:CheY-like chemotaxis protein